MDRIRTTVRDEGGYVLALGALLLVPLLVATGFAVDVGSWYARAGQLQKVADAASLGGVVWLPDQDAAEDAAREVLARNGFPDSNADGIVDGTDVAIEYVYPGQQQFTVNLKDNDADMYFSGVVVDEVAIERQATAEYVLPLAMGSPRNFLGTGSDPADVLPGGLHENFWLAISGPCASRENGEWLQSVTDANYYGTGSGGAAINPGTPGESISWEGCNTSHTMDLTNNTTGDSYDPDGYFYAVKVPAGAAGNTLYIDVYDAPQCNDGSGGYPSSNPDDGRNWPYDSSSYHNTVYTVRGPDGNPYVPSDNPQISTRTFSSNQDSNACGTSGSDWQNTWKNLQSIANAEAGIYFVQVRTTGGITGNSHQHTSNQFSLRASYSSSWTSGSSPCSSDESELTYFDENCPQVYAIDNMGVYANLGGSAPSFFLTSVGDEHSGKVLEVDLWDPGEGAIGIEIIDPIGRSVDFDWQVINLTGSETAPTGGWNGTNDQAGSDPYCTLSHPNCVELDVMGNPNTSCDTDEGCYYRGWNPQPGPYRGSRSKYSDRRLHLEVELPADIEGEYSGATWWRIRYTLNAYGANTDRTTWSVTVTGDPVRLVD